MVYISLHETLARTTGQRVRLKIIFKTKKESVAITDPGHIVLSILQGMETRFEKCGELMRKYGGRSSSAVRSVYQGLHPILYKIVGKIRCQQMYQVQKFPTKREELCLWV